MNLGGRIAGLAACLARRAALAVFVLAASLGAAGFFAAALFLALARGLGPIEASLITGAALAALALVAGVIGVLAGRPAPPPPPPNPLAALFGDLLGRDPRKAVLAAVIAGVMAEFLAGRGDRKN